MGHTRLGVLPKTRLWREVVRLLQDDAAAPVIAARTRDAAQKSLERAARTVLDHG